MIAQVADTKSASGTLRRALSPPKKTFVDGATRNRTRHGGKRDTSDERSLDFVDPDYAVIDKYCSFVFKYDDVFAFQVDYESIVKYNQTAPGNGTMALEFAVD